MIYARRPSPLHAARAAVAAGWSLALVACALMTEHPLVLGTLLAITVAAAAGAHAGTRVAAMARFAVPLAVLMAAVNALVVRDGLTVLWRFGEIPPFGQVDVTLEGVAYGAILGLRAVVILFAAALFAATVDPDDLLRLFRRISLRSALTAALAVRLVPVLQRDGRRLAEASRCRVDAPGRAAVLRAVVTGALDRAADVAATLEVRGYGTGTVVQPPAHAPVARHDAWFTLSAAGLVALMVLAEVLGVGEFVRAPETQATLGGRELALCGALALVALLPFAERRGIER